MKSKLLTSLAFAAAMMGGTANANSGNTEYPIVLVHGLSGFDSLIGIDYWYRIPDALGDVGADDIYVAQVTAFETGFVRGEELLDYVEDVLAITGADKVNLIGHSLGGPTSRYVATTRPDLVASVTSVASPHFGSDTADVVLAGGDDVDGLIGSILDGLGSLIATLSGDPDQSQNAVATLEFLGTEGSLEFNEFSPEGLREGACQTVPLINTNAGKWWGWIFPNWVKDYSVNDGANEVNGVRYYSWTGKYNPLTNTNVLDPVDGLLLNIAYVTHGTTENDGLVERCSSHMGKVIRDDYTLNHMDQVNFLLGLRGLGTDNPLPLYKQHAQRLKNAGL